LGCWQKIKKELCSFSFTVIAQHPLGGALLQLF
jgi:hypothetical protein